MNKAEFLKSDEFNKMLDKVKKYKKGFTFTVPYNKMTEGQKRGMDIFTRYCIDNGLLKSVSFSMALNGEVTDETFCKI